MSQSQEERIDKEILTRKEADGQVLEFWSELRDHVHDENEQFKKIFDRIGEIETDLRPIKKLYYAVVGSGVMAGLMMAMMLFIYSSDRKESDMQRADIKELGVTIFKHGVVLERTVVMLQNLEADYRRNTERR